MSDQSIEHVDNPDFTDLIQGMMPMAEKMLDQSGAFLPYAAILYSDGEIRHLTIDPSSKSHDVEDIVKALEESLSDLATKENETLSAMGLCMDIKMHTNDDSEQDGNVRVVQTGKK